MSCEARIDHLSVNGCHMQGIRLATGAAEKRESVFPLRRRGAEDASGPWREAVSANRPRPRRRPRSRSRTRTRLPSPVNVNVNRFAGNVYVSFRPTPLLHLNVGCWGIEIAIEIAIGIAIGIERGSKERKTIPIPIPIAIWIVSIAYSLTDSPLPIFRPLWLTDCTATVFG